MVAAYRVKASDPASPHEHYDVLLRNTGRWSCDCPHFVFRGAECKHIRACEAVFLGGRT